MEVTLEQLRHFKLPPLGLLPSAGVYPNPPSSNPGSAPDYIVGIGGFLYYDFVLA